MVYIGIELWLITIILSSSITCFEIVTIPDGDIQYLYERLRTTEHMTDTDALNTIIELENYYTAAKNGLTGEPSEIIDTAWHAHILNTPMYFSFCQSTFGSYLHHSPYWMRASEAEETQVIVSSLEFQIPMFTKLKELGIVDLNETIWTSTAAVIFNEAVQTKTEL
ncbi:unnamed protein product [Adineta ricciae]|uniref:Uncharacterized protein n=1 Tax=Adineta ricciae TaxID=249248 RepID=A0A815N3C4_ADIRI|nr:unnamed protein product [Adineta ricciae]